MARLAAMQAEQRSASILLSFEEKWTEPLLRNEVAFIFRKKGPAAALPKWVYLYFDAPTSAIMGRMPVLDLQWMPLHEALKAAADGAMTKDELRAYAGGVERLAVISVGPVQRTRKPIYLAYLKSTYDFEPPEHFLLLSKDGQAGIDKLAGFAGA